MKKNIVIFGSGAHSKVIFSEIIKIKKYNFLGFVDDFSRKEKKIITYKKKTFFNLGKIKDVIKNYGSKGKLCGIIGVGFNHIRKKIVNEVFKLDKTFKWEKIISKNCIINGNTVIGEGSLIMSGVIINTQTKIGNHCIINTSSSIDHDNNFRDFSSCGPNVTTGGNVTINTLSYIGISSTIKHKIKILSNTIIGAKSYINKNCKSNNVYFGTPAKKIRTRKIGEKYL